MKTNIQQFFKNRLAILLSIFSIICCAVIAVIQHRYLPTVIILQYCVGLCFMLIACYTDIKEKLIKNKLVLYMLTVWFIFAIIYVASFSSQSLMILISSAIGGAFSLVVFGAVYIVTKKQLGGGDVKLSITMGLFLTSDRIIGALIYGLLICALYSGFLLITKKINRKDTVALAPFLTIGYFISMLFVL